MIRSPKEPTLESLSLKWPFVSHENNLSVVTIVDIVVIVVIVDDNRLTISRFPIIYKFNANDKRNN